MNNNFEIFVLIAFFVFSIFCWIQKREILNKYAGVFGRVSSLIVFMCFMAPFTLLTNKILNPENYLSLWFFVGTALKFWIPGAVVWYFSYRKCPQANKKGMLYAMIRCGCATCIQAVFFLFILMWFMLAEKKYYRDGEGNIYEYMGW